MNTVTNDSGFMPLMYAFRYGMYIVPHSSPAPSAAAMPEAALRVAPPDWCDVA